jgi:hypothetical protein
LTGGTLVELGLLLCEVEAEVLEGALVVWNDVGGLVRSGQGQPSLGRIGELTVAFALLIVVSGAAYHGAFLGPAHRLAIGDADHGTIANYTDSSARASLDETARAILAAFLLRLGLWLARGWFDANRLGLCRQPDRLRLGFCDAFSDSDGARRPCCCGAQPAEL